MLLRHCHFFPWSLCLTFRLCVFRAMPSLTASACPRWRKKTRACMSAVFLICGLMKVRNLMFMLHCMSHWLTAWWLKRLCHTFRTVDHWGIPSQLWEVPHLGGPPLSLAKILQEVKCQGWGSSGCLKSLSLVSCLPSYPPPQWPGHQLHPCQETQASSGSSMGLVSECWRWVEMKQSYSDPQVFYNLRLNGAVHLRLRLLVCFELHLS